MVAFLKFVTVNLRGTGYNFQNTHNLNPLKYFTYKKVSNKQDLIRYILLQIGVEGIQENISLGLLNKDMQV